MFRTKNRAITKTLVLLVGGGLSWLGLVASRASIIEPRCSKAPDTCQASAINPIDSISLSWHNYQHAHLSDTLQWISAAVALLTIALLKKPKYLIPLISAVVTNGIFLELVRFLVQRPRPYVYRQMVETAASASSYTSFYSGHTSFVAITQAFLIWILLYEQVKKPILFALIPAGIGMIIATGLFRVTGGQHFITDVIAGAIAGAMIGSLIARAAKSTSMPSQARALQSN